MPLNKVVFLCMILVCIAVQRQANATGSPLSAVDTVLQKGFPDTPAALSALTSELHNEYENQNNIVSLIFYAYGMLRLANHYDAVNDYVRASEYSKTGFFYLDEAADSHENDPRVRYLRARIDAYLPAKLGRCVVALGDTDFLLKDQTNVDHGVRLNILYMRYRAMISCKKNKNAEILLEKIKNGGPEAMHLLSMDAGVNPPWNINEISQVVMPLVKGE